MHDQSAFYAKLTLHIASKLNFELEKSATRQANKVISSKKHCNVASPKQTNWVFAFLDVSNVITSWSKCFLRQIDPAYRYKIEFWARKIGDTPGKQGYQLKKTL